MRIETKQQEKVVGIIMGSNNENGQTMLMLKKSKEPLITEILFM